MGQWNRAYVFVRSSPVVWNESEDFRRDPVDWGELVLQGQNQADDLESILLEKVDLKRDSNQPPSTRQFSSFDSPQPGLQSSRSYKVAFQFPQRDLFHRSQTYFVSKAMSCRIFLVAHKSWDTEATWVVVVVRRLSAK